jgi:hypothetical protein
MLLMCNMRGASADAGGAPVRASAAGGPLRRRIGIEQGIVGGHEREK